MPTSGLTAAHSATAIAILGKYDFEYLIIRVRGDVLSPSCLFSGPVYPSPRDSGQIAVVSPLKITL